ncbi:MAG: hypothetical protein JXK07_06545 [Spirochaetes bacterium]|nr:hypothetical protein [Spirochaetota bacterium]MBN2771670.1 hypothetical protein [Spirochaetota bacterium]
MKKTILIIALICNFTLLFGENLYKSTRSICDWSLTQSQITGKTTDFNAQVHRVPDKELSTYKNYILNHISGLDFDGSLKPEIYYQENDQIYRDFIFVNNRLSAISCRYALLNEKQFMTIFSDLKKDFGAPETKREQTTTTHSFKKGDTAALFMIRSKAGGFEARLYFYTNDLFKRIIIQVE